MANFGAILGNIGQLFIPSSGHTACLLLPGRDFTFQSGHADDDEKNLFLAKVSEHEERQLKGLEQVTWLSCSRVVRGHPTSTSQRFD